TLDADYEILRDIGIGLIFVGAGLFGSFLILRIALRWAQAVIARRVEGTGWISRIVGALAAGLVDVASVLLAWAIGYAVALLLVGGTTGRMGINQSLLLNAFLLVELLKLAARLVLSPRYGALRLLPVNDDNAAYWSFWLARLISLVEIGRASCRERV